MRRLIQTTACVPMDVPFNNLVDAVHRLVDHCALAVLNGRRERTEEDEAWAAADHELIIFADPDSGRLREALELYVESVMQPKEGITVTVADEEHDTSRPEDESYVRARLCRRADVMAGMMGGDESPVLFYERYLPNASGGWQACSGGAFALHRTSAEDE